MDEEKFQRALDAISQNRAKFYSGLRQLQNDQNKAKKRAEILRHKTLNLYKSVVEQGRDPSSKERNTDRIR